MMNIDEFFEKMSNIQTNLMEFLDRSEDTEEKCENFILLLSDYQIFGDDQDKFKLTLKLISKIAKNHNRNENFLGKIYQILTYLKNKIKEKYSNFEIFNIFKSNKIILLFLFENDILSMNQQIYEIITSDEKYKRMKYPEYFIKEINQFIKKPYESNKFYEESRKIGENETLICKLIRKDLIDEFIQCVYELGIDLQSTIELSLFETNSFLMKNPPTLIEYSAFYGSLNIFKYLVMNNVKISLDNWLYAIHSNKEEMICYIKDLKIEPNSYEQLLEESIKCHHNNIANEFLEIHLERKEKLSFDENVFAYSLHYHNYLFSSIDIDHENIFFYACQFNYFNIVKYLLQNNDININNTIISKTFINGILKVIIL